MPGLWEQKLVEHFGSIKLPTRKTYGNNYTVGHTLLGQGRYAEALEHYTRALDLGQPTLSENNAELGQLYGNVAAAQHMLGNLDKALKSYRKAEQILPRLYHLWRWRY
jgi:tetratricopeptide (TPR) repeat protein